MPESPRRDRLGGTPGWAALADFLVCLIVTAAWAARALPTFGTHLRDAHDAQFLTWEIAWVRHAIVHSPAHVFDANFFAPARNALAFTEPLIGYGLLGVPLGLAGLAEAGVTNVLCLLGIAFSAWAISRLAVSHGVPRLPALLGAFAASLGAQTAGAFGYVSFVVGGGIALVLVAWKRLRESGRWPVAFALGAAIAALGWFSLYVFAFGLAALFAIVTLDVATNGETRRVALLARLAAALAFGALLLAPLAWHMLEVRREYGFKRDESESRLYSAAPRDWLATTSFNPGQAFLKLRSDSERSLYPGTAALGLSAAGVLALLLTRKNGRLIASGALLLGDWPVGTLVVHEHALPLERLRPTMELAAAGLRRGALEGPYRFDHVGGDDWVFFFRQASDHRTAPTGDGAAKKDEALFLEHVAAAPHLGRFDDAQFPASIDEPAAGQVVRGELKVRGWSQTPGAPAAIVEIRIDRDTRAAVSFGRTPRPDVAAVLPALGSCGEAGYEARFPMLPGDDGVHDLHVVFRAADGRMRRLSRAFEWAR